MRTGGDKNIIEQIEPKEMISQESETETQYKLITFMELRQMQMSDLRFKLRQNRGNIQGI